MNDRKFHHVLSLLKSWENGYIAPSAQMAIKDARIYIEELHEEIGHLSLELETLKGKKEVRNLDEIEF